MSAAGEDDEEALLRWADDGLTEHDGDSASSNTHQPCNSGRKTKRMADLSTSTGILEGQVRQTIQALSGRAASYTGKPYALLQEIGVPRDQKKNHDAIAAVIASLSFYTDITPLVMHPLVEGKFSLLEDYGIDPKPLFSLNSASTAAELFLSRFGAPIEDAHRQLDSFIALLRQIEKNRLLGYHTTQKWANINVKDFTNQPLRSLSPDHLRKNTYGLLRLATHTTNILQRYVSGLEKGHARIAVLQETLGAMESYCDLFRLHKLFSDYPLFESRPPLFYEVFADFIVETVANRGDTLPTEAAAQQDIHFRRYQGVDWTFTPRSKQFIFSGDEYGDCTAYWVRSQVNETIVNIHWTVYAWMLDPYYRVLEIFLDGKRALKCHILPLIIQERPVLMLDAIEAVPQLRENKDGSENPNLDRGLYNNRVMLLESLFDICKQLAHRMRLEVIYVEKFSNARWIREAIDDLPSDSYHINEVKKPYTDKIIRANIENVTEKPRCGTLDEEVQARNLRLMNQYMQHGYKDVAVLMGRRENWRLRIAGP
jgi:hypothetical protein